MIVGCLWVGPMEALTNDLLPSNRMRSNKAQQWLLPLVAQTVKRLPKMWETWVQSLGWEDPLEKEMATHSSILA